MTGRTCPQFSISNAIVQYLGQHHLPLYEGTTASIHCQPTYKMIGPGLLTCTEHGWSGVKTQCIGMK